MSAPHIRCDHDALGQVSQMFSKQSSEIAGVNKKLKSAMETLEGGDWIGRGATAFFQEMNDAINPSMQRLQEALDEASSTTKEISKTMEDADDEAQRVIVQVEITISM
jgi:WXG100 family type VII secretion target